MLQVLHEPAYMEDHVGVLEEEHAAGQVPLPSLPKYKQVGPVHGARCRSSSLPCLPALQLLTIVQEHLASALLLQHVPPPSYQH